MVQEYFTIDTSSTLGIVSDEQFFELCSRNRHIKLERTEKGEIVIVALTDGQTGNKNFIFCAELHFWIKQSNVGLGFDSSTGFRLDNGAIRSPDAAFITSERWNALTAEQKSKFPPICPDFVAEILSESDRLRAVQDKMGEWIDNGCRLAWLIDRENQTMSLKESFNETLSGEEVLPGFELRLSALR
jgi:Uma2 family endonuclease